jgi:carbon-monoxide dehydrogenase large subunit
MTQVIPNPTPTSTSGGFTHVGADYTGLTNVELALGKGTFVSDLELPGMAHAAILRSPHAHARITSIDTSAAQALDGVVDVMTGEEARSAMRPIPEAWDTREIGAKGVHWYPLTPERVRYVGEAIAAVVAEDKYTATRARDLIEVSYEPLPAVTDPERALEPDSPLVEPDWGDNLLISRDWRAGDVEASLARAKHVAAGVVRSQRITGVPLEARGVIASWDHFHKQLTYWESTQNPHPLRTFLAETLGMPENGIRVIQPRVGGAFGLKQPPFQEEPLLAYLSLKLRRPVKWIEERDENFQATEHSRDVRFAYEVAFGDDGVVDAIDIRVIADVGAPTALLGWGQSFVTGYCLPTCYKIPNARIQLEVVVTNKCRGTPTRASARTRPRSSWKGSWTGSRARPAWTGPRCACATSSRPTSSPTRSPPARCWTAATTTAPCARSWRWWTTQASPGSRPRPRRGGGGSGSASARS